MRKLSSIAVLAALLISPAAQASDRKTLPGNVCHATDSLIQKGGGNIHWFRTLGSGYAACPIIKDNTGNTGMEVLRIYGRQDQFVTGSWCEAGSLAVNGGGAPAYNWGNLPQYGVASDYINFGSTMNAGQTDGMFFVNCFFTGDGTKGA